MTSSAPSWLTAADTARSTSPDWLVSACRPTPLPPAPSTWRAVSSALLPSRSTAATRAPRAAIASAMPRPMPEPAPVTTATLSCRSTVLSLMGSGLTFRHFRSARDRRRPLLAPHQPPPLALSSPRTEEGNREGVVGDDASFGTPPSNGQGVAVAAGVGAGHQRAGLGVAGDALSAAHHPRPVVDHVDLVSAPSQLRARGLGDARLRVEEPVAVHADPGRLDRLLQVQAELEEVEHHLRLGLQDPVGARGADRQRERAVLEHLGRRHHGAGLA